MDKRDQITTICDTFSNYLIQPPNLENGPINMRALLQALAEIESSYGENNVPRFEESYAPGGYLFEHSDLLKEVFNKIADEDKWDMSCSWSPWQIMFICAYEMGFRGRPKELSQPEVAIKYIVKFLNTRILRKTTTILEHVFDAYNSGNARDHIIPGVYIKKCMRAYAKYTQPDDPHVLNSLVLNADRNPKKDDASKKYNDSRTINWWHKFVNKFRRR